MQEALQSHSVYAVNLNTQNPQMNQIFTPFCKLCRTEGHTVMYSPRKQNQSNFQSQNFYRPDQNLFGDYSNRTFRPFQRNQNQFHHRHFRILDHNKTLPKLGIVSLETKMVPERKLNIAAQLYPRLMSTKLPRV